MSLAARVTHGALFQTLNTLLRGAAAFVLTPILIAALGTRHYGFWATSMSFFGAYELFDFGVSAAVSRHLARAIGSGDRDRMRAVVGTSFAIFCGFGALVAAVAAGCAALAPALLSDPEEARLFRPVILVLGGGMALTFPLKVFRGVLVSHVRYDLLNAISMTRLLVGSALTLWAAWSGAGLVALAWVTALSRVVEGAAFALAARRVSGGFGAGADAPAVDAGVARELFSYGGKAFAAQVADMVRFRIDTLVVAAFVGLDAVTFYDVGQKLLIYGKELTQSALNVMVPVFSRYEGAGDFERIREGYLRLTRWAAILSALAGSALLIYGRAVIERWVGPGYDASVVVLLILAVPTVFELIQGASIQVLYGISRHHWYALVNVAEAAANFAFSVALVKFFGLYGVALGTALEILIFKSAVLPALTCREVGLPLRRYYRDLGRTMALLLPPLAVFGLAVRPLLEADYARVLLLGALQAAVFLPFIWFALMDASERALARQVLAQKRPG